MKTEYEKRKEREKELTHTTSIIAGGARRCGARSPSRDR